ncbi:TolC family protein [Vibrio sp. 99-70-13A1]|uniref:TolC family protein n=1 Tax=Vibrio sp. 99-70-13A1 TaxID=2607601 RepID=UPI00149349E5|nr:TolC family protein [Vibrio sp. 99-70-13A1]NOH98824.1 TolC family protein [Vibrio sp. 99-70-13A1]
MTLNLPLKHSVLSLVLVGLIGCSSTNQADYTVLAEQITASTNQQLLLELIQQSNLSAQGSEENQAESSIQITDLVSLPELDTFITQALETNPSFQQSVVALNIAYAQQGITAADRLPTVEASFSGKAQEDSDDTYTTDLTVGWELDLWQKLADSSNASMKDVMSSQASLQGAQDLVVANLMRTWLEISLKQQLVTIEEQRLVVLENNEGLVLARYKSGLGSLEDLDNAKSNSASTKATLADYREQLASSKRSLTLLTGQWVGESLDVSIPVIFPEVLNPLDMMPDQNLSRRPDLQSAFLNIEAEALRTDAAYKAMLPSISLSASLSDMAESPSEALLTGPLWSVLGQVSAPLFQGGKLKSQAEVAQLTTEQTYWAYQETLLNAVNEVENTMGQEGSLALQQQHLALALESAQRSFVSYKEKYRQGLVDIFDLLTVQQQTYDLEAQLTQTIYNRLVNRIDLGLALGLGASA